MKKTLIAMLIAVVSTSLFAADYYAYDYKASIKRIDLVVTYKKNTAIMQKYKVASDTIKGVVVIPICENCLESGGINSSIDQSIASEGWFIRVGDKLSEKYGVPYVAHDTDVFVATAKFGAYTLGTNPAPQDRKNNKLAWMKLGYVLGVNDDPSTTDEDEDEGRIIVTALNKNFAGERVDYRFLGASNSDAGYVVNTGFGTVKPTSEVHQNYDPCTGLDDPDVYSCDMVISITGTLCGGPQFDAMMDDDPTDPYYNGLCGTTPMWDLCNEDTDHFAVICGTWTLKYNAKLTESYDKSGNNEEVIWTYLSKAINGYYPDVYIAR